MKFYRYNDTDYSFFYKIQNNKLNAIYYSSTYESHFYKNGEIHNAKNAAVIVDSYASFYLNGKKYGYQTKFTKKSWRRFVKMQVFL